MNLKRFIKIVCILSVLSYSGPDTRAGETSIIDAIKLPKGLTLCGESVPVELQQVRERFEKEMMLSLWDRPQVVLWLKRAPRYFPFIEQQLKEHRLPDDLKYVVVAESALRPHAGSSKGAIGFWQLMPQTARKNGLTVDEFIDERRNLYLSTSAALKYLKALNEKFSSWTMAIAAYNMGEEGLAAEVLEQDTKNYYHLYLPLETQRFVFRVLTAKMIMTDPQSYGFKISPDDIYQPVNFDTVGVDCFQEVPIQLIAKAAGTYFKTIKDLNPHLRGHYIRAGHFQINVPTGSAKGFDVRFNQLVARHRQAKQRRIYVVQEGDTLSGIAEKFEVPLAAILIWNRVDLRRPIHPGERLILYPRRLKDVQP
ncbi:MAG: transglycosylase SLT domain-containing protein [Desulfobacteraceae bacterium]|jgi:hypothetical protein